MNKIIYIASAETPDEQSHWQLMSFDRDEAFRTARQALEEPEFTSFAEYVYGYVIDAEEHSDPHEAYNSWLSKITEFPNPDFFEKVGEYRLKGASAPYAFKRKPEAPKLPCEECMHRLYWCSTVPESVKKTGHCSDFKSKSEIDTVNFNGYCYDIIVFKTLDNAMIPRKFWRAEIFPLKKKHIFALLGGKFVKVIGAEDEDEYEQIFFLQDD